MKRHWFILLSIAIVILLFRVKWDVKKIYVKDYEIKEMVEKILTEKYYRFSFVDNEENTLVIEKDRVILPPNDIVLHLDWSEEKKEKARRLAESLFQEEVALSATETKIATEDVILERALDSFFRGDSSFFENGYYCGDIYLFLKDECVARYDPKTEELVLFGP
ncbi:hypothetical protein [Thermotoga sp. SG1]|uniref:hypothetical protein n=1 Tax=Thermotoga sp. SG1 TaxID=126739 RepID=UPI000C789D3A|nr:hypothetical protein [Thermotoga sp. SG1]PLV56633.1 hypothetical protein AS006_03245 [Thermotoga sp. SG1]